MTTTTQIQDSSVESLVALADVRVANVDARTGAVVCRPDEVASLVARLGPSKVTARRGLAYVIPRVAFTRTGLRRTRRQRAPHRRRTSRQGAVATSGADPPSSDDPPGRALALAAIHLRALERALYQHRWTLPEALAQAWQLACALRERITQTRRRCTARRSRWICVASAHALANVGEDDDELLRALLAVEAALDRCGL